MILVSGRGTPASERFGGSLVIVPDASLLAALDELQSSIDASLAGGNAVVWIRSDRTMVSLPAGDDGSIQAGAQLDFGGTPIAIRAGSRVVIEGKDAGTLTSPVDGEIENDLSIRYFYKRSGAFGAVRFRVFPTVARLALKSITIDPSRPDDTSRNFVRLASTAPVASNFRTPAGTALQLEAIEGRSGFAEAWDPVLGATYKTPDGFWRVIAPQSQELELMFGLSGAELARVPSPYILRFVAGAPAFAPWFGRPSTEPFPLTREAGVDKPVETAWVYLLSAIPTVGSSGPAETTAGYYAEPEVAPLFRTEPSTQVLRALSLWTAPFPVNAKGKFGAPHASFPSVPYAGLESGATPMDEVRRFENDVLTPARRIVIDALNGGPSGLDAALRERALNTAGPTVQAVTPQGLYSEFSDTLAQWQRIVLARSTRQVLQLGDIDGPLRSALLNSQLFLVISDPKSLEPYSSYTVTDETLRRAVDEKVPQDVTNRVAALKGRPYRSLRGFEPDLRKQLEPNGLQYFDTFVRLSQVARLDISGWTFDLAPARWAPDTMLVIKFAERDFESLAKDLSLWTAASAFNKNPGETQRRLLDIIAKAKSEAASQPELSYFVKTVLGGSANTDTWNGVLYLNAPVPAANFPPQLRALAGGIRGALKAHHLGINVAPFVVKSPDLVGGDSSLFGLILYEDPNDLVYQGNVYDYKVISLRVLFTNSAVSAFSSLVELLVAELFGERVSLRDSLRGDNIILTGTWQRYGDADVYSFTFSGKNYFDVHSSVVDSVIVTDAQFVTLPESSPNETIVRSQFVLGGSLRFRDIAPFDLFSFGPLDSSKNVEESAGLRFSNLLITLEFDRRSAQDRTFRFQAGQMSFDAGASRARDGSLYQRFPLRVTAMRQSAADAKEKVTPQSLGFIPVDAPLDPGQLGPLWFGLEMDLLLGSPGALAAAIGYTAALLAAWAPSASGYNAAIGIRLPASGGGKKSMAIAGPLTLDIGRINFLFDEARSAYLLRFQNVALGFLGVRFPPSGKTNVMLFGDPEPRSTNSALGWYAAYKKDDEKKKKALAPGEE